MWSRLLANQADTIWTPETGLPAAAWSSQSGTSTDWIDLVAMLATEDGDPILTDSGQAITAESDTPTLEWSAPPQSSSTAWAPA